MKKDSDSKTVLKNPILNSKKYFIAYSSAPSLTGQTILEFVGKLNKRGKSNALAWQQMDIPGQFIRDKVLEEINKADIFIADISVDNFNVIFEIGYAIGIGKPIILIKNRSIKKNTNSQVNELGIYDTIGYLEYENSKDLLQKVAQTKPISLLSNLKKNTNFSSPVFMIDTKYKTEYSTRVTARVKKERLKFRAFDPNESTRLSANETISHVSQSLGVIVYLLHEDIEDFEIHNLRASFIAGLSTGMEKTTCILQYETGTIPIDFRDFTETFQQIDQIDKIIQGFSRNVYEKLQDKDEHENIVIEESLLKKLDFGASSAENEMGSLKEYYLKTDQFNKASRGEVQLVVGRKGSGKSAIFIQLRDKERNKSGNIVIDLKPEGYILLKFKEKVLDFLESGTKHHTIMAIWEYLLLLEVAKKILDADKLKHKNDNNLFDPYIKLDEAVSKEKYITGGDFAERMQTLLNRITSNYKVNYSSITDSGKLSLSEKDITKLLHTEDIKDIRTLIIHYLKNKNSVWILFDNIDKGWPTSGLTGEDLIIIRTLIDATSRLKRSFNKENLNLNPVVFLRNDVFELLVENTADKGKESKVILDWTDRDLLKELIRLRAIKILNDVNKSTKELGRVTFEEVWSKICVKRYKDVFSIDFILDHCLMRPRFLINLLNLCKGCAINLNHAKINEDDIDKAMNSFSSDLLLDVSYEIRDVIPEANDVLYAFVGSEDKFDSEELLNLLSDYVSENMTDKIIDILLWYGFLGIEIKSEIQYIYNLNYNMQVFKGIIKNKSNDVVYHINPAFWSSLMIS